jgi:hypothetical protein
MSSMNRLQVPAGLTAAAYTEALISEQLPAIMAEKKAGTINPQLMDVFCEKGVFSTEQSQVDTISFSRLLSI